MAFGSVPSRYHNTLWTASCIVLGVLLPGTAAPAAPPEVDYEANIQKTLAAIYDGHDKEAVQLLAALENARPGFPAPAIYRSLLAYWRAFGDPGDTTKIEQFRKVSDDAIRIGSGWTEVHSEDADGWRYLASAFGQRAQFSVSVAPNGADVVRYGLRARDAVMKAYNLDKGNKDVLIGLGAANYFAANIPWFLRPIAFALGVRGGDREEGMRQIREGMEQGKHSGVEGAMVLSGALYTEAKYAELYKVLTERVTSVHPSLLPAATWAISGCICGNMLDDARKTVEHAVADDGWRYFQLGRIALAKNSPAEAETDFSKAIEKSGGNHANLTWAYDGRALARKRNHQSDGGDVKKAQEASPAAHRLADRMFHKPGACPH
jgi:tetratricopeptide (TPR) repeat protein